MPGFKGCGIDFEVDMELRLRFFTQWSQAKKLWQCAACRQYSNHKDFDRMTIVHRTDCKYLALTLETHGKR